eukprot:CAMPEP_0180670840 /NCGR_PEP_ID=MMETSP1037_2-20121125/64253_1 /TAXON_ID=632150 /ORGANISM="Azadinium spinosum, Strain 3D9" /LENGTH=49 /DNA_ID=CAMNT_0022699823 /DNA_START=859 /DNA_END=1008 /DNA_ORIENTATION=+
MIYSAKGAPPDESQITDNIEWRLWIKQSKLLAAAIAASTLATEIPILRG